MLSSTQQQHGGQSVVTRILLVDDDPHLVPLIQYSMLSRRVKHGDCYGCTSFFCAEAWLKVWRTLSFTPIDESPPVIKSVVDRVVLAHGSKACRYLANFTSFFHC